MDRAGAAVQPLTVAAGAPAAVDDRTTGAVGRTARLELVFALRGGRTVLAHAYAEPPLRAGQTFSDDDDEVLHMILASSAPGMFAGDAFEQTIVVEEGARVRLTTQSSLQVHPGAGAAAQVRSRYLIAAGAALSFCAHPVIPFPGSRLEQANDVHLATDARLFWSDAIMCGRAARGERWRFASLASELCIRRDGALEYLERYRIEPMAARIDAPWIAGDACYAGTAVSSGSPTSAAAAETLHRTLQSMSGVRAAADALSDRLLLVRMMARDGVPFHRARALAARAAGVRQAW
jgi:urease accessory protein